MPRDFRSTAPVDLWTPLRPSRQGEGGGFSNYERYRAPRTPGVTLAGRQAISSALPSAAARRSGSGIPPRGEKLRGARLRHCRPALTGDLRTINCCSLGVAVLMVLLIGCVNIAGLLLARSALARRGDRHPHGARRQSRRDRPPVTADRKRGAARWPADVAGIGARRPSRSTIRQTARRRRLRTLASHPTRRPRAHRDARRRAADHAALRPRSRPPHHATRYPLHAARRRTRHRRWTPPVGQRSFGRRRSRSQCRPADRRRTHGPFAGVAQRHLNPGFDTRNVIAVREASLQDARYRFHLPASTSSSPSRTDSSASAASPA